MNTGLVLLFALGITACSPKIYLIDRQTVLEDEAAGEWPDFEKELLEKTKAQGPTPLAKTANSSTKERVYNLLNGELANQQIKQTQPTRLNSK